MVLKPKKFYRNFYVIFAIDLLIITFSFFAAHMVRFEFDIPPYIISGFLQVLPIVIIIKLLCFSFFDLYRGMWRFTSIADLINIIKSSSISSLLIVCIILLRYQFIGFSRSVFFIDWCFTILFISGFRLAVRFYFETTSEEQTWIDALRSLIGPLKRRKSGSINLLIVGAGNCGEKIYREIRDNARLTYQVVGFVDDDPSKQGKKIHGIPVLGAIKDLKAIAAKAHVQENLIAIPSASAAQMREIVTHCKASGIAFKTIPAYGELIDGKININTIREVAYRDLIGRETIKLDEQKIGAYLKGQCVLVTGAGGSVGSELCRQICKFEPEKIVLLERAESPLYEIELELKQNFTQIVIVPVLADIQDPYALDKAFALNRPQIVFHAAAYKHVPMIERQPWKAIDNNIMGTKNLAEISSQHNVERFVFVSTDKAVRPANVMGASKRLAEMIIQAQNGCGLSPTRFMIVRFGNVVGSVGSVVPLFKKQIQKGGPVTVTDPNITRFFMTIPEACQLILQAGAMGNGGEIFILDMGTPVKIDDMARDLIRLSGFEPDLDINIEYIGLRPGEKLYEELITEGENVVPTSHEKIMVLKGLDCNLQVLNGSIEELNIYARDQAHENIIRKLKEIVPDYTPFNQ